jgi:recombination protein RecR
VYYGSETLAALVKAFSRLPGIGAKTAQRLTMFVLRSPDEVGETLGQLLMAIREKVRFCDTCGSITETQLCAICTDPGRDPELICVVEEPQDVLTIEKTGRYRGRYHVLHGVLSPIDGITPEKLNLAGLGGRVRGGKVKEVIVATNPTIEGDTTALYITKSLAASGVTVTRLARGLPMGGTLEFADDSTLAKAIECREKL